MISTCTRRFATSSIIQNTATLEQTAGLKWNDYFRMRVQRNRFRPLLGIPSLFAGVGLVVAACPYNPVEPMLGGIDPTIIMGMGAMAAGLFSYQLGTFASQTLWRLTKHRQVLRQFDSMDSKFYNSVAKNRAERGQSPYIQTLGRSPLRAAKSSSSNNSSSASASGSDSMATDYYGERVKSLSDYRQWLRRQHKLTQQQSTDAHVLKKLKQ